MISSAGGLVRGAMDMLIRGPDAFMDRDRKPLVSTNLPKSVLDGKVVNDVVRVPVGPNIRDIAVGGSVAARSCCEIAMAY